MNGRAHREIGNFQVGPCPYKLLESQPRPRCQFFIIFFIYLVLLIIVGHKECFPVGQNSPIRSWGAEKLRAIFHRTWQTVGI